VTDRLQRLRERYLASEPEICVERAQIITRAYQEYAQETAPLLRAKSFAKILREMTIFIAPEELIVGNLGTKPRCAPVFPEFSVDWILKELDSFEKRTAGRYYISEENKAILRELLPWWKNRNTKDRAMTLLPQETREAMEDQAFILTPLSCGLGHIAVDYRKILEVGLQAMVEDLQFRLDEGDTTQGDWEQKTLFYRSCIIVCQALMEFAERYAQLAEHQAAQAEGSRREELLEMARICRKVPRYPSESFHEALQSFWFLHLALQIESNGHSMSPGRFDQYMNPYFLADQQKGVPQEWQEELLGCLWIKFSEINKLRDANGSLAFGGYPMFQNLLVGGVDRSGRDCTNEVSLMCCKVTGEMKLSQPSLSVRWHRNADPRLLDAAAEVARSGIGMPAYFNDEAIIPILQKIGCSLDDARNYAEVGCVEPQPAGRCEGLYSSGFDNLCKILELAVFDGENPLTGKQLGPHTGTDFASFEEFYQAYLKQQAHILCLHARAVNAVDFVHSQMCPTPLVSCFVEDCIERGMDVRSGGAHYNFTSPNAVGLANVADSLAVIQRKIYEEHKLTFGQLKEILRKDYQGYESLRQEFLNDVPKYGNDDPFVDGLARRVGEDFCLEFKRYRNVRQGTFQPGLQSISAHALFVGTIGATPDGRTRDTLVSDGGVSPAQGRDVHGPTAALRSVSHLNHLEATNGALLNVKFHPSAVQGPHGKEILNALLDSFFRLGGQHVQFNIVDSKVLRDAQVHPENYRDLVVRVAGFSVLFTTLDRVLQNDIIERTQHNGC
jgi:pyruvate formate-lyase/glycerol dehydratase family glycyl radical enzyme